MILVTQLSEEEHRDVAREALSEGCHLCSTHEAPLSLLDHHDGLLVICDGCSPALRAPAVKVAGKLIAALVHDDADAEKLIFGLELARLWRECKVPLPAFSVMDPNRWGHG